MSICNLLDSFSCPQNSLPLSKVIVFRDVDSIGSNRLSVTLFISSIVLFLASPASKYFEALSTCVTTIPVWLQPITVRDMPIILEMQGANSKATRQESPPQASEELPDSLFAELALELERLRSLQLPNPIQPENVLENKILITPEHEGMDKAHLVAALCHQLLNELGADSFGERGKNSYRIQRSGDALTVESLRGDRQIILQVKGQEIEFANLSEFDIQQFEQARQLQKELKKEHWRDK